MLAVTSWPATVHGSSANAFPARDDATVRAFHAAALAAGYGGHGAPAERPVYHPATTGRSCSTRATATSKPVHHRQT